MAKHDILFYCSIRNGLHSAVQLYEVDIALATNFAFFTFSRILRGKGEIGKKKRKDNH